MENKKYYFYVLRCVDNSLYTGITTDVKRRFDEHRGKNGLGAKYTRSRKPVSVVAVWMCPTRSEASKLEYAFKQLTKNKKEIIVQNPEMFKTQFDDVVDFGSCNHIEDYTNYCLSDNIQRG